MSNDLVNNDGIFRDGDPLPSGFKTQTEKILEKQNQNQNQKEDKVEPQVQLEVESEVDQDIVDMFSNEKIKILCTTDSTERFKEYDRKYPDSKSIYRIEKLISKYKDLNNNIKRFNDKNKVLYEKKSYLEKLDATTNPDKFDKLMNVIDEITQLESEFDKTEHFEIDGIKFESSNDYTLHLFYSLVQLYTGCNNDDMDHFSYHTYPNKDGAKGVFDIAISLIILVQRGPVFLATKSKK